MAAMILSLFISGWQPTQESFDWANEVLQRYSDRNAILGVHQYIAASGKYEGPGQEIYEKVVAHKQDVLRIKWTCSW